MVVLVRGGAFREELRSRARYAVMPKTRTLSAQGSGKKGNFADRRNCLLSLFTDPEAPSEQRWRETFGYERRPEKPKGSQPFIAREARKSSSDSK